MPKRMQGQSKKAGFPPGSLIHIGKNYGQQVKINILDYDENHVHEEEWADFNQCPVLTNESTVTWVNIEGIHETSLLEKCGEQLGIHLLVLEDILNTQQRPKWEDYGEYSFVVLKIIDYHSKKHEIETEQVSLILGKHFVISFQERAREIFHPVRERIVNGKGFIRKMGVDFLAYSLLDVIVDNYFVVLETVGEQIELLEEELISRSTRNTLHMIYKLKREMLFLRKAIWPLREVVGMLDKGSVPAIQPSTAMYLRDVYDHVVEMMDMIDTYRDMLSGMLDIYLSSISNRMNEVMKVLTVIATLFIPLTFIVGVYGMNFQYMPELAWRWGYPGVWILMLAVGAGMLAYFRRKKWL